QSAGCELNFAQVKAGFGTVALSQYDPGFVRPYINQYNIGVSHELFNGVSVTGEWFRTVGKNLTFTTNNTLRPGTVNADGTVTNASYRPVTVFSPFDGSKITMYDTSSTAANAAVLNNIITDSNRSSVYNGFDFNFNARLAGGGRLFG